MARRTYMTLPGIVILYHTHTCSIFRQGIVPATINDQMFSIPAYYLEQSKVPPIECATATVAVGT